MQLVQQERVVLSLGSLQPLMLNTFLLVLLMLLFWFCRRHEVMSAKLLEYAVDTASIDIEQYHVKQLQDIVGSGSLPRQLHWDESRAWQLQVGRTHGLQVCLVTGHDSHSTHGSMLAELQLDSMLTLNPIRA
jgi:hypothetical protein